MAAVHMQFATKEGWGAAVVFLKADLEGWQNEFGMMSVNALADMCSHCLADRRLGGRPWCDFRREAAWRATVSAAC